MARATVAVHGGAALKLTHIVVCGVLVLVTTLLVRCLSWDPFLAAMIAGGCAIGLVLVILLGMLPFLDASQRREVLALCWKTARDDLRQIIDLLTFRR